MKLSFFAVALFISILTACSPEPQPINFGRDECSLCKMTISQNQWGAEIVTNKARVYKFDAIECMAKYINDGLIKHEDIHSCWTVTYDEPGEIADVEKSFFLHARSLPSPMAMFLTGFSSKQALDKTRNMHSGEALDWKAVLSLVKTEWGD